MGGLGEIRVESCEISVGVRQERGGVKGRPQRRPF